jgi:HEAT repeat protein
MNYNFTARAGAEADSAGVRLDEEAVGHLLRALTDADSGLRAYAAYALRHVTRRDPRVREALTAALQDEDAQVRRYAWIYGSLRLFGASVEDRE